MEYWDHMGGWGMFGMFLFWTLLIVGIVFLVRFLVQQQGTGSRSSEESPLDVLKKRYARGEISKDEYERIRKDIAA